MQKQRCKKRAANAALQQTTFALSPNTDPAKARSLFDYTRSCLHPTLHFRLTLLYEYDERACALGWQFVTLLVIYISYTAAHRYVTTKPVHPTNIQSHPCKRHYNSDCQATGLTTVTRYALKTKTKCTCLLCC